MKRSLPVLLSDSAVYQSKLPPKQFELIIVTTTARAVAAPTLHDQAPLVEASVSHSSVLIHSFVIMLMFFITSLLLLHMHFYKSRPPPHTVSPSQL